MMKIDQQKAYDMVNLDFIEDSLKGYNFPRTSVQLVKTCVTTTRFTVKVNGEGYGYFDGKRGIRQGDPIFPLLFM